MTFYCAGYIIYAAILFSVFLHRKELIKTQWVALILLWGDAHPHARAGRQRQTIILQLFAGVSMVQLSKHSGRFKIHSNTIPITIATPFPLIAQLVHQYTDIVPVLISNSHLFILNQYKLKLPRQRAVLVRHQLLNPKNQSSRRTATLELISTVCCHDLILGQECSVQLVAA